MYSNSNVLILIEENESSVIAILVAFMSIKFHVCLLVEERTSVKFQSTTRLINEVLIALGVPSRLQFNYWDENGR